MGFRVCLLAATALVALSLGVSYPAVADPASCSQAQILAGTCTASVSGTLQDDETVLEGHGTTPGTTPGGTTGTGAAASNGNGDGGSSGPECLEYGGSLCVELGAGRDDFTATRPVTLADIAHFRPTPGVDHMEPNGWMVVGLDTNFFATGGQQVHDGTLLDQPASVRFTPVAWHWSYGDGASASRSGPGATWAALGVPEFERTGTSHVYRTPGTYYIDLAIDFAAEYRFAGTGWIDIAGTLRVPANRLVATAGDAKTVLVERECTVDPTGPGC